MPKLAAHRRTHWAFSITCDSDRQQFRPIWARSPPRGCPGLTPLFTRWRTPFSGTRKSSFLASSAVEISSRAASPYRVSRGSRRQVNHYLAALSHVLSVAMRDWGWMQESPMSRVPVVRVEIRWEANGDSSLRAPRALCHCAPVSRAGLAPTVVSHNSASLAAAAGGGDNSIAITLLIGKCCRRAATFNRPCLRKQRRRRRPFFEPIEMPVDDAVCVG
jgi:hypothetical protein